MPRKTLALISGLVIVTIVLFIIALRAGQQPSAPSVPQNTQQPTPMVPAHTILKVGPNPLTVVPGQLGHADITMDTSDNNVTAVQLEIGYDPRVISNVKINTGPLFVNPVILIDKNNPATGRYTYAFGITPNSKPVTGAGVVATVTFTPLYSASGKDMQLGLLPTSLVTARGVAQSVLKSANGTVVTVGGQATPAMYNTKTTGTSTGVTSVPPARTGY